MYVSIVATERFNSELGLHLQQAFLLWFSSWDRFVFSGTREDLPPVWPGYPVPQTLNRIGAVAFCWLSWYALLRNYLSAAYCLSPSFHILRGINKHNHFAITIYFRRKSDFKNLVCLLRWVKAAEKQSRQMNWDSVESMMYPFILCYFVLERS